MELQSLQDEISTLRAYNEELQDRIEEFAGQVNALTVEAELARLEFIQVFNAVNDSLWILDNDHVILRANNAFAALFHLKDATDAIGRKCYDILKCDLSGSEKCPLNQIREKRRIIEQETILDIEERGEIAFLQTAAPFIGLANEDLGIVIQIKDISERKAYEEALKESNRQLEGLARIDALTQIPNRRVFNETLRKEWKRMQRARMPISLLMIDVDFFKLYNDHYGHAQGDDCLKQVANAIKGCVRRPYDLAARYGGEEFCCLLPETDRTGAEAVANAVLNAVRNCEMPHAQSKVSDTVTVSIGGVSVIPEDNDPHTKLITHADQLLYKSKDSGRNRVTTGY